jgi:GAF domain-containing protein
VRAHELAGSTGPAGGENAREMLVARRLGTKRKNMFMAQGGNWAGMALRLEQLAAELVDLQDVGDTLEGSLRLATIMAPCDVASVSLTHTGGRLETTSGSDPVAHRAHELQQELGEGPCLEAEWVDGEDVRVVQHVADDERWPRWAPEAHRLGLSSMLAVKLATTDNSSIGVLDLYAYQPRHFDTDDLLAARVVATRVSTALAHAQHEQTLWRAIDARHHIGQAQGLLMERYDISSDAAFAVLRRYSQEQNRKLHAVAHELITTRTLPDTESR